MLNNKENYRTQWRVTVGESQYALTWIRLIEEIDEAIYDSIDV
jgi:hypothetical protein